MKIEEIAKQVLQELFELIGIKAEMETSVKEDEKGKVLSVGIASPEESGLLIGSQGSTLTAIQTFLAVALKQKTGEWVRVVLDIGDYRGRQEEHLIGLAQQAAVRAKSTGTPQPLYNLTAGQRRLVHMALSEDPGVTTESVGEGEERYLVVKPKAVQST